jgi:hypothetical protein
MIRTALLRALLRHGVAGQAVLGERPTSLV